MFNILFLLLWFFASPVQAFSQSDAPMMNPDTLPLPKAKEGSLPWKLFLSTRESQRKITFPDGGYAFEASPIFSEDLRAFDGKQVKINGFMFPLEQADKQANFLFGPFPPSCPFHYHVPPTLVLEVKGKKPLPFSWDELMLQGTLKLVGDDKNGVYYFLIDAQPVTP